MKTNKILKVTGIMQSVLIGILLLFAICLEAMSCMNFYTYDYSLNFDYSSFGQSTATTRSYSFSTLFLQPLHLSQACQEIMFYMLFLKLWILHRWYCPYISFTNPYAVKARWQTA